MKISDLNNYTVLPSSIVTPTTPEQKTGLGQKILNTATGVSNFFGGKGVSDLIGASLASAKATPEERKYIEYPKAKEVAGSVIQLGSNLIPAAGIEASLARKALVGATSGYAFDVGSKLQNENKTIPESLIPGAGTAIGATLPVANQLVVKPAIGIVGRLFKGLGSGLSGASTKTIDEIINNPQKAIEVSKQIEQNGGTKILEDNAKTIVNGVSKIRQEARAAYGKGLESLSKTDINPSVFRQNIQNTLDKYGIYQQNGQRLLSNIEFSDPKNIQKASDLIDKLHNAQLDGKSLRSLSDTIENSAYKVATSDERLSFNAFVRDLADSVKNAVTSSTNKLDEINKNFSNDLQLTEAVEDIFGKVDFKNLPEVVKASQKLENLFSQKGLAPEVTNSFLNRIGISPSEFKTSEAVRQLVSKEAGSNTKGLSIGEVTQQVTSSVLTPDMVRRLSIATGLTKQKLVPFLQTLKNPARNIVIQALLQSNQETPIQSR